MRIFGETPGGQKACLHLHRAFPYFYVPYDDDLPRDPVECGTFLKNLCQSLERAMELALSGGDVGAGGGAGGGAGPNTRPGINPAGGVNHSAMASTRGTDGSRLKKRRFVHDATLVRAKPFYGYHSGERLFVKLRMYDPSTVQRAAAAMLSGGIMNRIFQPHESHVPYLLQVKVDHNLHGMGLARLSRVCFRDPVPRWPRLHRHRRAVRRVLTGAVGLGGETTRPKTVVLEYDDVPQPTRPRGSTLLVQNAAAEGETARGFPRGSSSDAMRTPEPPGNDVSVQKSKPHRVWTRTTIPRGWDRAFDPADDDASAPNGHVLTFGSSRSSQGGFDPPERSSNVEIEVDGCVEHLTNPKDVVRQPLATAAPPGEQNGARLVQSLAPVWEEETRRAAARGEPAPVAPSPPPRNVRDLTKTDRLVSELSRRVAVAAAVEARDETGVPVGGALTLGDILREERGEGRGYDVSAGQSQRSMSVIDLGESRSRSIDRGAFETQTPPGLVRRWSQDGRRSGDDPDAFLDAVRPANASSQDNGSIEPSSQGKAAAGSSQRARKKGRLSRTSRAFDPVDTDDVINEEAVTASQADPRRSVDGGLGVSQEGTQQEEMYELLRWMVDGGADRSGVDGEEPRGAFLEGVRPADDKSSPVENADGTDDNDVEATVREAMLAAPTSAMKAVRMARESLGGGSFIDGSEGEVEASQSRLRKSIAAVAARAAEREEIEGDGDGEIPYGDDEDADDMQIAATQRECDDIIACTAPSPVEPDPTPAQDPEEPEPKTPAPPKVDKTCRICGLTTQGHPRERSRTKGYAHKSCANEERRRLAVSSTPGPKRSLSGLVDTEDDVPDTEPQLGSTSMKRTLTGTDAGIAETPEAGCVAKRVRFTPLSAVKGPCFICGEPVTETDRRIRDLNGYAHFTCAEDDSRVYRVSSQRKNSIAGATIDPREDGDVEDDATFALRLKRGPPDTAKLLGTLADHGLPSVVNQKPFYGRIADAPARPFVFAGRVFRLPTSNPDELPPFSRRDAMRAMMLAASENGLASRDTDETGRVKLWALRPIRPPPSRVGIDAWLDVTRSKSINLVAAPDVPIGATPADRTEAARKSVAEGPPPSPFFNPPGGILRMSAVAAATGIPDDRVTADDRLDRWLETLHEADDDEGIPKAGGNRGQSGPAQVGLGDGDTFVEDDDGSIRRPNQKPAVRSRSESSSASPFPHRPPSPKYDDPSGFIELLRYDGCEAHPDVLEDHAEKNVQRTSKSKSRSPASITRSARRRSRRRGFSQLTPPDTGAGVDSTPNSDSVEFRSQGGANTTDDGDNGTLNLGVMCVECIGDTRGDLLPNPRHDSVLVIAMRFSDDGGVTTHVVALILRERHQTTPNKDQEVRGDEDEDVLDRTWGWGVEDGSPEDIDVHAFDDETELLRGFINTVRSFDPDVIAGFEIQGSSLGYLAERAAVLNIGLLREISRDERRPGAAERQDDEYGRLHASGIHVTGRIVINLWRTLRGELKLQSYTLESCAHAVLRRRLPCFPAKTLARWARGGDSAIGPGVGIAHQRWRAIRHATSRSNITARMMEQLDLVARTAEQARIFGIDFFSVLSRGSQYRVESMLLRLAHTQNYVMISPNKEQVARQPAMECLPLVMEPESKMYDDPVAVLDFQSLYPSMVIAYNLCYSTCMGRVPRDVDGGDEGSIVARQTPGLGGAPPAKLGVAELALPRGLLPSLINGDGSEAAPGVTCAPNGVMFAPHSARPGVLPRLLTEILDTRVMVKQALKRTPADQRARRRALNARQFGLKLIANVTYGYTAAGFSGRMPMAELADAIVQSGRETLERAIQTVHSNPRWGARVVYGDTDSLFVHMPGRTVEEAHVIGQEIAAAVTAENPPPVVLKLEKVYSPCMLVTKKRYVGHMFETPSQTVPTFDAKGIETVRRDSCPAVVKIMRTSLRLLFASKDLSLVKRYVQSQLSKILAGRVPIREFIFAKEVRLGTYSSANGGQLPPAALVASKALAKDPRGEPKHGERVRYVVTHGQPGARLIDMVFSPGELIESRGSLRLHAEYYCKKQIVPALQRCLGLVGADVPAWLAEVPPPPRATANKRPPTLMIGGPAARHGATIDGYYLSRHCAVCGQLTKPPRVVCEDCGDSPMAAATLSWRGAQLEHRLAAMAAICAACGGGGGGGEIECFSLDCPVYFERMKADAELDSARAHIDAATASGGGLVETLGH